MRIVICDDQAIVRDGLAMLLRLDREIEVVGTAQDGLEAVELAEKEGPDLVLMDLKMPGMNGIEATRRIAAKYPAIKVLVLTTYDDDEWVFDAIRAGASGYLLKDAPHTEIVKAIKDVVAGGAYTAPTVTAKLLDAVARQTPQSSTQITEKLTEREVDVLRVLARGLNNADIAEILHVSEGTVRNHISAILAKLDLSDRTQAAVAAVKHGIS